MNAAGVVDAALEWPHRPSFRRLGYDLRSHRGGAASTRYDQAARSSAITGAARRGSGSPPPARRRPTVPPSCSSAIPGRDRPGA